MAHGIMICDVPIIRDLTKVNVQAYLASKLVWVDSLAKFELLTSLDQTYEFVITVAVLEKTEITDKVIAIKNKNLPKVPLVIIGHYEKKSENIGVVPSGYDQAEIIKFIIKQLKWTPTEYAQRKIDDYIPIPLNLIKFSTHAIEDLFLPRPESELNEYVLAASKGEDLHDLIKTWIKLEVTSLYVSKEKRLSAASAITKIVIDETDVALKSNDENLQQVTLSKNTTYFAEIFEDPKQFDNISLEVKEQISELAQKTNLLINKVLVGLTQKPNVTLNALITSFRSHEQSYIPQLSFLSTYVSLQMMKSESWFNEQIEEKVRYLHFFNNLIIVSFYKIYPQFPKDQNIFYHYPKFTDKEKELYRWHPKISANMVASLTGMPVGLDQLILQHHGNINGDLQNTILHDDLSILAKYCFIAEQFSEYVLDVELPMSKQNFSDIIEKIKKKITLRSYVKIISELEKIVL